MQSSSTTPESSSSTSIAAITVEHQTLEICKVRFDDQCILIPDPVIHSRMPRLVKKSYSLPLWRRRSSPTSSPPLGEGNGTPASPEENHLIFTLPVPRFVDSHNPSSETIHSFHLSYLYQLVLPRRVLRQEGPSPPALGSMHRRSIPPASS
ncbi:hypothetical protein NLI96_g4679 [Meripilus lineatus]|uniref:Uncharacterized protein n=1 Tax=Meripilus lineatus TaxID=2056292 RepID=A0AAD5V4F4_9APHY|nr:hypothetical protein NLI96_g4679 [Physisporinus lineatus]